MYPSSYKESEIRYRKEILLHDVSPALALIDVKSKDNKQIDYVAQRNPENFTAS